MRNLKRALSLALAAIMLLGMMVVGAGAVSYNDFSDRTEIVNKDAVSMLTTLGVIDGKPDGSYAPEEFVTREQMAKMISVIMNQGSDNNDLFVGVPSGLTDVAGNWALGHINYCYSLGIIAGRGDGRFDPTANVTASEAAKMLLVAAGYNPSSEGFVGADWSINVNAKASALGIFRNYTKSTMADLNRDDAALLIYNALDIEMIQKYEDGYAINFNDRRTILSAMYGVYKIEGVVVANQWAELDGSKSEDAAKAGTTILDDVRQLASTTNSTDKTASIAYGDGIKFNVDTTEDMMGKRVTLFIEKTTILSDSKVLGVALKDDVNVVMTNDATVDTAKDYLKGTGLAVTKDTEFYVNYEYYKTEAEALAVINDHFAPKTTGKFDLNGITMEVIDHDNDGDVDYVLYKQETLSKVSRYSEKNETVSFYAPTYASENGKLDGKSKTVSVDFEDAVFADDVTTDDLILYIQYGGRTYISLPEIVTGVMSRIDRDKNNELFITVEGEEYRQSYILDAASLIDVDVEHFDIESAKADIGFSSKWDFILDSTGKYVVAYRPAEETVTNYALVIGSAWTQNALDVKGQVKILKTDGTEGTYYINWDNSAKVFDAKGEVTDDAKLKLERYLGTRDVQTTDNTLGSAVGTVITYSLSDDDILTIKNIFNLNTLNADDASFKVVDDFTKELAYVGANTNATTTPTAEPTFPVVTAAPNLQYTLKQDYKNGDGYVSVTAPAADSANANAADKDLVYAIDKNTVAFYYKDASHYGVAIGWDNMSDVDKETNRTATKVQVYPVMKKDNNKNLVPTNLAELVLFNAEPKNNTADWLLVLTANAVTSKVLELNVVFEDGTTKAIEVSRSKYDEEFDKPDGYAYNVAYAYSVNSDGTYELNLKSRTPATTAELLKNGTLDVAKALTDSNGVRTYPTLLDKSNVWDITDMNKAGEDAPKGSFIVGEKKNAVIIANNDNKILQTAWIWDYDEKDDEKDDDYDVGDLHVTFDGNSVRVYNPNGASVMTVSREVINTLKKYGADSVEINSTLTLTSDNMGNAAAVIEGNRVQVPVIQVYDVSYNNKSLGLFASSESAKLIDSGKLDEVAFLVSPAVCGTGMTEEASKTEASATAGNIWSTEAVNTYGVISFKVPATKASDANKTFAIVDAYTVTNDNGDVEIKVGDTTVNDNEVVADGTTVTVTSTYAKLGIKLVAIVGDKETDLCAPNTAQIKAEGTWKVTANTDFVCASVTVLPSSMEELKKSNIVAGLTMDVVAPIANFGVAVAREEKTVDENGNVTAVTVYLESANASGVTSLTADDITNDNRIKGALAALNYTGEADRTTGQSLITWYRNLKNDQNVTKLAIVPITVNNYTTMTLISNGTKVVKVGPVGFDGIPYTIDFSGVNWDDTTVLTPSP